MKDFNAFTVDRKAAIRDAFNKQGLNKEKFVIVTDESNKVIGVVTDGDVRRAIWDSISLDARIDSITNRKFVFFNESYSIENIREIFSTTTIRHIPVLKKGCLVDIIFKSSYKENELMSHRKKIDIPVVIMAGGKGSRLDPFTRILPKPLIPIGEKPVIEIIIDKFMAFGVSCFYISVNHKAKMIKAFFEDFARDYKIVFIEEAMPLGTAGALGLIKDKIKSPVIVSNCDIIIEEDYSQIIDFHMKGKYLLTLVGSMQRHVVPYGVCKISNGGELRELTEKPEYDFLVNTGMYVISPQALDLIPQAKKFDATELIEAIKQSGKKVGVYPIDEKSWIDIGQWEEYKKAVDKLEGLG